MAEEGSKALDLIKDSAISYLVQLALDKLFSYLESRVGSLLGDGDELDLEKIKSSLNNILAVIGSAEERPFKDQALVDWLERLKDATYDAEDVLDEYATDVRRKVEPQNSNFVRDPGTNKVRKIVSSLSIYPILNRTKMTNKLKEIRKRLESIEEESHKFQLSKKVQEWEHEFKKHRQTYSYVVESEVYGRDKDKERIVNLLLLAVEGHIEDEKVSIIPIVGLGGQGKTTLAQLVFNNDRVQNHFQLRMWVCVSDDFDVERLVEKIIDRAADRHNSKEIVSHLNVSDLEMLQLRVRNALNERRFLLVLDDVWNEEREKWNKLRVLLNMCGGRGSKIVVTTRNPMIASIMSRIEPHHLEGLSEEDCWKLFASRAFPDNRENDYLKLVEIGKDIVRKCAGVPLAVITLGSLLSFKREESEWMFVRDSELWNLAAEDVHGILPALRLSYYSLNPHLRQCFAFCAIFPKNYNMNKELLIQLWMANGCIPSRRGMELEDIGIEILNELLMKSLFQEVKKHVLDDDDDDSPKIKVHDLVHDLAQSFMGNDCCIIERGKPVNISKRVRHLSSYEVDYDDSLTPPDNLYEAQSLRTLLMLGSFEFVDPLDMAIFKSLRVLDLGIHCQPRSVPLPTSLGELIHLRYLRLANVKIETLPESISSLQNLQTLKLNWCRSLRELPKGTRNLINLRCLDMKYCHELSHMPAEIRKLSCLRKLPLFVVGDSASGCSGIEELQCLNDLRGNLRIERLERVTIPSNAQRANLIGKPYLDRLELSWGIPGAAAYDDTLKIEVEEEVLKGLQPHENLKELYICGYGGFHFPSWLMGSLLPSIVEIDLACCGRCKLLPPLGQLPSLKFLNIEGMNFVENIGSEFYGNDRSERFPSLKTLMIQHMSKLKLWLGLHGERVFPRLVELQIVACPMLTIISCFTHLTALQKLTINGCKKLAYLPESMQEFSTLRELRIISCSQLPSLPEWLGNLTALQLLVIGKCPQMVSLPAGLERLTGLQRLSITLCPELQRRCDETGQDLHKIRHILEVKLEDGAFMTDKWMGLRQLEEVM